MQFFLVRHELMKVNINKTQHGTGRQGKKCSTTKGDMHMVAARLGCERAMVGTRWATSRPDRMDKLRKHYSHLVEGWFLGRLLGLWAGVWQPIVLTIAYSSMSGHSQGHESAY